MRTGRTSDPRSQEKADDDEAHEETKEEVSLDVTKDVLSEIKPRSGESGLRETEAGDDGARREPREVHQARDRQQGAPEQADPGARRRRRGSFLVKGIYKSGGYLSK